jgi:hypothetical protein
MVSPAGEGGNHLVSNRSTRCTPNMLSATHGHNLSVVMARPIRWCGLQLFGDDSS